MDRKRIGNTLRELRGLQTAAGVARQIGISTSALLSYETGERIPRDDVKKAICRFYRKGVGEVFFPDFEEEGDG